MRTSTRWASGIQQRGTFPHSPQARRVKLVKCLRGVQETGTDQCAPGRPTRGAGRLREPKGPLGPDQRKHPPRLETVPEAVVPSRFPEVLTEGSGCGDGIG